MHCCETNLRDLPGWPGIAPRMMAGGSVLVSLLMRKYVGLVNFVEVHSSGVLLIKNQSQLSDCVTPVTYHELSSVASTDPQLRLHLERIDEMLAALSTNGLIASDDFKLLVSDASYQQACADAAARAQYLFPDLGRAVAMALKLPVGAIPGL